VDAVLYFLAGLLIFTPIPLLDLLDKQLLALLRLADGNVLSILALHFEILRLSKTAAIGFRAQALEMLLLLLIESGLIRIGSW
jgi:hypothetical protein